MGLAAERPSERLQMSSSKDVDLQAEAERIRREQRMFMKVPGSLTPIGKMEHEKAAVASQMKKKSLPQLKEILERQEKLLANKSLVARLPDRGAKARVTVETVSQLIRGQEQELELASQLERLKLPDTDAMEWRRPAGSSRQRVDSDDSDQETESTLRLLAEKDIPAKPEQQLEDLDLFAAQKAATIDQIRAKERFIPFSCTEHRSGSSRSSTPNSSSNVQQPPTGGLARSQAGGGEDHRYLFKEPPMPLPPGNSCQTRLLSLQESLELQQRQDLQSRQVQLDSATARLLAVSRAAHQAAHKEEERDRQVEDSHWRDTADKDSDDDDDDVNAAEHFSDDEDEKNADS